MPHMRKPGREALAWVVRKDLMAGVYFDEPATVVRACCDRATTLWGQRREVL